VRGAPDVAGRYSMVDVVGIRETVTALCAVPVPVLSQPKVLTGFVRENGDAMGCPVGVAMEAARCLSQMMS
jgi:hypothetical protein